MKIGQHGSLKVTFVSCNLQPQKKFHIINLPKISWVNNSFTWVINFYDKKENVSVAGGCNCKGRVYYQQWPPKKSTTRQVSSMIHSAKPTVSPVVNIVFTWYLYCLARFWKVRTDGRWDGRTKCLNTMITTGSGCGSATWIKTLHF